MISVADALKHIDAAAVMLQTRRSVISKPIAAARDYRLAAPAKAQLTHPPADMSAMDGYAARAADIDAAPVTLKLIGEARAGVVFTETLKAGELVRIFTGGVIPKGADTVVIQENTRADGDQITVLEPQDFPRHIRPAGQDFNVGDILIPAGTHLSARHIALAAAGNIAQLNVFKKLKIALLSNGDELRPVGSALAQGQIINSNGPALKACLETWGAHVIDLGITPDNMDAFKSQIIAAKDADIIVPIGGASVGDHDLAQPAFAALGYDSVFSKIAVKPGKPVWAAQKGGQFVLGLPGNPASALVCAHLFLRPLIGPTPPLMSATLGEGLRANGPRETYLRGHVYINEKGQLIAAAFPRQDSGLISPFARANILLRCPPHSGPWAAGDVITGLLIAPVSADKLARETAL